MNAMQMLSSQPWVERLGWTLLHFLWQGLAIAVLYAAARRGVARASSPHVRYLLACAALAAMMAAPLVTGGLMRPSAASPDAAYRIRSAPPAASATGIAAATATLPASVRAAVSGVQPAQFLLWVVMVWLAGAVVFWVRLAGGWVVAARMRSVLVRRAPPEWQENLRKLGAAVAANGGSLAARIARLLGQSRPAVRTGLGPGVLAVAILLVAAAYGLFGQSDAHPAFQVASIKRNTSNWSEPTQHPMGVGYRPGGRLTATNASLKLLIQFAYAVHDSPHSLPLMASQVVGGPTWIDSPGYDIEAKPEGNTDPKRTWLMLQTLLAGRFKLALHRETRELPVYALTAAKNGFKLPAPKEVSCVSFPPGTPPRYVPGKVDCGYVPLLQESTGLRMEGSKVHMADLIRELALVLDRPVLDRTEFTGEFDLNLSFTPDEALMGLPGFGRPGDPGGSRIETDPNLPNVFAALEEQLGLKLVPAKGPVEVLVIDHAERPTAN